MFIALLINIPTFFIYFFGFEVTRVISFFYRAFIRNHLGKDENWLTNRGEYWQDDE